MLIMVIFSFSAISFARFRHRELLRRWDGGRRFSSAVVNFLIAAL